jgi:hypothetical protein
MSETEKATAIIGIRKSFVAIPYSHTIEPAAWEGVRDSVYGHEGLAVNAWRNRSSLLAHNFNECVCKGLKDNEFDYIALLHSDMGVSKGWIGTGIQEMDSHGFDVIHAPAAIKNGSGLTSTAGAYVDDEWAVVRRLTMKELRKLPTTFGIDELREHLDADLLRLLPNTGCMIMKVGPWLRDDFPGFQILSRINRSYGDPLADVVPEDWNFGHWADRNGIKVGGTTAIVTRHVGPQEYPSDGSWGEEVDTFWKSAQEVAA